MNNQQKLNNFDDGWGFYIDIETLNPILTDDKYYIHKKYDELYYNDDYYNDDKCNNSYQQPSEDIYYNNIGSNSNALNNFIIRVSSTTIITAAITYVVLFML
jgi:hypothetical protein